MRNETFIDTVTATLKISRWTKRRALALNFNTKTMKPSIILLLISLFPLTSIQAQKKTVQDANYFITMMKTKFDLVLKKDTVALRPLLHDSLLYIHSSGSTDTREMFLKKIITAKNPYKKFSVSNERVRFINAKTVLVHARCMVEYEDGSSSNLLITEAYTKEKKNWLLISRHANKIEAGKQAIF